MYQLVTLVSILCCGLTAVAGQLNPQLEQEFKAELSQHTDSIPESYKLKTDRFIVWKKTCSDGKAYVFKKRKETMSEQESSVGKFHPNANLARFDQAEKFRKFIADQNLTNVRIPVVYKIRFKDGSQPEDDTTTGIVEEFISHPDLWDKKGFVAEIEAKNQGQPMDMNKIFSVDITLLPDPVFRSLETLAVKGGLCDLHYGNVKYDALSGEIWLTDLEDFSLLTLQRIKDNPFTYPLRPYLRWQIEQDFKIGASNHFIDFNKEMYQFVKSAEAKTQPTLPLTQIQGALPPAQAPQLIPLTGVAHPERFLEIAESARLAKGFVFAKKEAVKGLTFYAAIRLAKLFYDSSSKSDVQIAYILDSIDQHLKEAGDPDLNVSIRNAVLKGGRKADATTIRQFTELYELMAEFYAYLDTTPKYSLDMERITRSESNILKKEKEIKKYWGKYWIPNTFSRKLVKNRMIQEGL